MTETIQSGAPYVAASGTNGELNDQILRRFLQTLVVGITGMDPTLVRPRWQPNPANEPDFTDDWAAIGTINRERDCFAAVLHSTDGSGNGWDTVYRNQILDVLSSFYGPNCEQNSELFAMGLCLAQNREAMELNGFGLVSTEETLVVPALLKERWLMGMDIHFRVRRQQIYTYPVPNLKSAQGSLVTDQQGYTVPLLVKGP